MSAIPFIREAMRKFWDGVVTAFAYAVCIILSPVLFCVALFHWWRAGRRWQ